MNKRILIPVTGLLICSLVVSTSFYKNNGDVAKEKNWLSVNDEKDEYKLTDNQDNAVEAFKLSKNAETSLTPEEYDAALDKMYDGVDEEYIEELDAMNPSDINDKINSFDDKYELGEPLSEEDAATLLYVYEKMHPENEEIEPSEVVAEPLGWETLTYKIGWSKNKDGVKTSYSGKFSTWTGSMHGKYSTDVTVKLEKGKKKIKSLKWTTYHNAYGLLGTSGKTPSIGKVYTGSTSSSKYTDKFNFEKSVTYSAIWVIYVSTYGTLDVKYNGGEYSITTKTYKSTE
ncbi:hypothetical protein SAMN02745111_02319 [Eubacterium uniforme]|uniref:Uncharacterized protein n=1 Tax=Eubacterium uniforme TaxID=39495 RepID=A0A1T4W4U9_9FIRM|nr:hypothetical protein [Eubacterium uniforme]SKA72272.1 hypothetical protein SAMN02745111_02319 [Eubacterium uniforme]